MATKTTLAAGFIIFRRISNEVQYLLLQASNAEFHWGPPKGRLEPGESRFQAALRETNEEAGISEEQMNIFSNFEWEMRYTARKKPKSVTLWLSEVKDPYVQVKISKEHSDFKWFNFREALNICVFENMKEALKKANEHIEKNS